MSVGTEPTKTSAKPLATRGSQLSSPWQPDAPPPQALSKAEIRKLANTTRSDFCRDLRPRLGCLPKDPPPPWNSGELGYRFVPYFDVKSLISTYRQVGLTPENLLHPHEEDCTWQENTHSKDLAQISTQLDALLRQVHHTLVLSKVGVDWQVDGFDHNHAPDLAVFYNYQGDRYVLWARVRDWGLGTRLVLEVVSPKRAKVRNNDVIHKVREYHQVGVPQYIVADLSFQPDKVRRIQMIEYQWAPGGYQRQPRSVHRRVRLNLGKQFNVWLGAYWDRGHQILGLFDGDISELIPDLAQSRQQNAENLVEIQTLRTRADAAEARVREIEALLAQRG